MRHLKALGAVALAALMLLEGFEALPYKDQAGVWTDGYGNTENVVPGRAVTLPQAKAKLDGHVAKKAVDVDRYLTQPATQGQSDAYQLLAYNIGAGAFGRSSVVKLHNAGRFQEACDAILRFNKIRINGVLTYSQGLANRRAKERAFCLRDLP